MLNIYGGLCVHLFIFFLASLMEVGPQIIEKQFQYNTINNSPVDESWCFDILLFLMRTNVWWYDRFSGIQGEFMFKNKKIVRNYSDALRSFSSSPSEFNVSNLGNSYLWIIQCSGMVSFSIRFTIVWKFFFDDKDSPQVSLSFLFNFLYLSFKQI